VDHIAARENREAANIKQESVKKEKGKEDVRVYDWDDDQEEMARESKERDMKARAKYEKDRPVKQENSKKEKSELAKWNSGAQRALAQESKARDKKAKEAHEAEMKEIRLKKAREFVMEEHKRADFRAKAAAEKKEIQAATARDRAARRLEQAAEKEKNGKAAGISKGGKAASCSKGGKGKIGGVSKRGPKNGG